MKIIECYEVITSSSDNPLNFKTFGYFKNREDGLQASKGQGYYGQDGSTSEKQTELVQFDSVEEFELYSQIKKLKNVFKAEIPAEMQTQLETFLSNPKILKENNKHNSFIQGWEIKIPYDWYGSKIFGFFTNPEDGIKVSKGKGYYGGHGSVFGDKPREIIVFENLDEFNKSKEERNNEIKDMDLSEFKKFYYGKEINYVGLSEIEPDNVPDSTESEAFSNQS